MGDIHANFDNLQRFLLAYASQIDSLTIVGDVGLGFPHTYDVPFVSPVPIYFIRGNHDNPEFIRNLPKEWAKANWHYIPDGTIRKGVLYIGGAWSIDWQMRRPGLNWWDNEELTLQEQLEIERRLTEYEGIIHTVITHDAPYKIYPYLHPISPTMNRTNVFLDRLQEKFLVGLNRPTLWVFGHHHKHLDMTYEDTRYICLNIERTMELDMSYANEIDTWEVT